MNQYLTIIFIIGQGGLHLQDPEKMECFAITKFTIALPLNHSLTAQ